MGLDAVEFIIFINNSSRVENLYKILVETRRLIRRGINKVVIKVNKRETELKYIIRIFMILFSIRIVYELME